MSGRLGNLELALDGRNDFKLAGNVEVTRVSEQERDVHAVARRLTKQLFDQVSRMAAIAMARIGADATDSANGDELLIEHSSHTMLLGPGKQIGPLHQCQSTTMTPAPSRFCLRAFESRQCVETQTVRIGHAIPCRGATASPFFHRYDFRWMRRCFTH
jgi:hypothetical protein